MKFDGLIVVEVDGWWGKKEEPREVEVGVEKDQMEGPVDVRNRKAQPSCLHHSPTSR